jgi:hypothetical protein
MDDIEKIIEECRPFENTLKPTIMTETHYTSIGILELYIIIGMSDWHLENLYSYCGDNELPIFPVRKDDIVYITMVK